MPSRYVNGLTYHCHSVVKTLWPTMPTSEQELLPLEGSSSGVWKHFGFPSKEGKIVVEKKKETAYCKLCSTAIKHSGSTSNMRFHLKEHHISVFDSLPKSASTRSAQLAKSEVLSETQPIQPSSARWYSPRKKIVIATKKC